MNNPEEDYLLKPVSHTENGKENNTEESRENNTSKPDSSTPLINIETNTGAPLAKPDGEDEDENIDKPSVLEIDDGHDHGHGMFLNHERDNDVVDLSDRAGAFPYAPGFGPGLNGGALSINPESIPDVNIYQHKKTVAQGMMDLALFSANANQLRYVLESSHHSYYYPGLVLISFSLFFQVAVGVGLLWNTRYDVKDEKEICIANKVNNFTVVGIFLITVINVFISAFGTTAGAAAT